MVDGYFWYTDKSGVRRYTLDKTVKVSIPTHMLLCEEGFEMPPPPKRAGKGSPPRGVRQLPEDIYTSLLEQLPAAEAAGNM